MPCSFPKHVGTFYVPYTLLSLPPALTVIFIKSVLFVPASIYIDDRLRESSMVFICLQDFSLLYVSKGWKTSH